MAEVSRAHAPEVIEGEVVEGEVMKMEPTWPGGPGHHAVTELLAQSPGALSPFGDDLRFPLPVDVINYDHPTALPNRSL